MRLILTAAWALALAVLTPHARTQTSAPSVALPALVRETLRTHPSLAALRGELAAAQEEVASAQWRFWPTPSINREQADRPALVGTDRQTTVARLRQPLWTGGRLQAELSQAEAGRAASEARLAEGQRDLSLEVLQVWGEAYAAQTRLQAFDTSLSVHERLLAQVRRRASEGLSAEGDIVLAESRRQAVLADRAQALAQVDASFVKLRSLSGAPLVRMRLEPPQVPAAGLMPDADSLVSLARTVDPTLSRLQAQARTLQARADSSAAALWPEVYARMDRRRGDVTGSQTQLLIGLESRWGGGLSALSDARAARQRQDATQGEIDARERKLAELVRADQLQRQTAEARAQMLAQALAAARGVAESWDRQFLAGRKSWQEVMNAAREVAQTEAQLAEAQANAITLGWRLAVLAEGVQQVLEEEMP